MAGVSELQLNQMASGLHAGLETLSAQQVVTFTQYTRVALPLDGYIFWVRSDLLGTGSVITVEGSVHIVTNLDQEMTSTKATNRVLFTAEEHVQAFNAISPTTIYLATFDGIRFAFSSHTAKYNRSMLWHYRGNAVYSTMATQIIDDLDQLNNIGLITSNSLPIWLTLNRLGSVYPSFLDPQNLEPPYITAHVYPHTTRALQSTPWLSATTTHSQLAAETVRITLRGFQNSGALDYQDYILQSSLDTELFGIMNMPIIRDEKETQHELGIIAMVKTIDFEINYNQLRVNDVARKYITSVIPTYYPGPY